MNLDKYVPVDNFGKDHWSTLAYAETVMVDCGGFQVGCDARMRQGRRNYRVMREQFMSPKRVNGRPRLAMPMELKHSTILKDGSMIEGHDDWHCIQDMAVAGFFTASGCPATAEQIEPGVILHLSALGRTYAELLREHKAAGGSFGNFEPKIAQAA